MRSIKIMQFVVAVALALPVPLSQAQSTRSRFKLQMHHETRELPVFELTVAKGGLNAKLADDQTPSEN